MGSFSLDMTRIIAKTEAQLDQVGRKVALTGYRRIILRTPVRTGRARGNWLCAVGAPVEATPDLAAVNDTDRSGRSTVATMQGEVEGWSPRTGRSIFLSNNLPYIGRLEHGSSTQAPNGMVAITLAELGGIAEDAAAEAQTGTFGGSRSESEIGGAWDVGGAGE